MPKLRKMLSDINAPYIQSLMRLIETQSTATIAGWCIGYAQTNLLPLWASSIPEDARPMAALDAAQKFLAGKTTLPEAKKQITACRDAAREAARFPVAQGAARAIDACASSIHNPSACLGIALYGALALAYYQAGTDAAWDTLEPIAAAECNKMEAALRAVAIDDEANRANIKWNC